MREIMTRCGLSCSMSFPLRKLASSFATLPRESKSCVDTNAQWAVENPAAKLLRTGRQVLQQIASHQLSQMSCRVFSFLDRVRAVGVGHHAELFVVSDQFVDQHFGGLIMTVVVAGSVNQQQVAFELFGKVDR